MYLTSAPVLTLPSGDEGYTVYRNYLCFMTIKEARAKLPAHDLEDLLWICVMDFGGQWDLHLPLIDLHITTVIMQVLKWLPMKHCMEGNAVGEMTYKLVLPPELTQIHPVFHVPMLRK